MEDSRDFWSEQVHSRPLNTHCQTATILDFELCIRSRDCVFCFSFFLTFFQRFRDVAGETSRRKVAATIRWTSPRHWYQPLFLKVLCFIIQAVEPSAVRSYIRPKCKSRRLLLWLGPSPGFMSLIQRCHYHLANRLRFLTM